MHTLTAYHYILRYVVWYVQKNSVSLHQTTVATPTQGSLYKGM